MNNRRRNNKIGGMKFTTPKNSKFVTKAAVKQMLTSKQENLIKYNDTYPSYAGAGSGIFFGVIYLPPTGTAENEMSGAAINLEKLDLRISAHIYNVVPPLSDVFLTRLVIVQSIGMYELTGPDVFQNSGSALAAINSPFRYETENVSFRVLLDYRRTIDAYNPSWEHDRLAIDSKIHNLRYDTFNSAWATGTLSYIYVQYSPNASTNMAYNFSIRTWWYDV
jgi:hypothetical protein